MEIIMSVTIPDTDLPRAVENACGTDGDLAEWLADFFACNDKQYLRDLGLGNMTIEVEEVN